jgi:hypothetical protein
MEYKSNKKLMENYKGDTRALLIAATRINKIEKVLNGLNREDREVAEMIFLKHTSQSSAEINKGISKAAYYNAMNKVIYLTAVEMDLI